MKIFLVLFLMLALSACEPARMALSPTGLPQPPNPEQNDDYYESDDIGAYAPVELPQITHIATDDGVLRLSMRHPLTLNPLLNQDVTVARILRLMFEPLITFDENFRPVGHLAEIEFASDFSSVILQIRNDAFWSDGTPVTAEDIIFSVNTLRAAPQAAIYRHKVDNIDAITTLGTRRVQVYFVDAAVNAASSLNFPIIPHHHFRNQANSMNPIGNGSFKFESYTSMRHITLVQNPYTFRQRPQMQEVEVIFSPCALTDLYAFDQGRTDALHMPLPEWVNHHSIRQVEYEIFPAMYFEFIGFNFEREMFHNVQVRRGIAHAFDACNIVAAAYLDHAARATAPIHPYYWAAGELARISYDPARGRALLNAVNIYQPLIILANSDNLQRVSIAQSLAQSLTAIGIPALAEILHYAEYFDRLESGSFDLFIGGVKLDFTPDASFFFQGGFYIEDTVLAASWNAIGQTFTEAAYLQSIQNFQQNFVDRLPVIGLAFRHSAILTNNRFVQENAPAPDNVLGNVNRWR